jgi:hypothetical protein
MASSSSSSQKADCWKLMTIDEADISNAQCNLCMSSISRGKRESGVKNFSTKPLNEHLQKKHPLAWSTVQAQSKKARMAATQSGASGSESSDRQPMKTPGAKKKEQQQRRLTELGLRQGAAWDSRSPQAVETHRHLLRYIVRGNLPLNHCESDAFIEWNAYTIPQYSPPSRKYITDLVTTEYNRVVEDVKSELSTASGIAFTTDIWTDSTSMKTFMSLSGWFDLGFFVGPWLNFKNEGKSPWSTPHTTIKHQNRL